MDFLCWLKLPLSLTIGGMTFRKKVFVSQKITWIAQGKESPVQALVSSYGAKYVYEESELPEELRFSSGQELEIIYKKIPVRCRLVSESTAAGKMYSFRFLNPSGLLLRQIEKDVRENGLPSPWLRSLPRLTTEAKHLPVPALAVVEYEGETYFLNVKNFTLGGLMLEHVGEGLKDVVFGTRLSFDLVTNGGDKIADIEALVTHVLREVNQDKKEQSITQFGMRFLPMSFLSETKYKELIKEHCLGLREPLVDL